MIMSDDKKKRATLIAAKLSGPMEPMENEVEQDNSIAEDSAAEELIAAIESKSPKAVVEAMKSLMELCSSSEEDSEAEKES